MNTNMDAKIEGAGARACWFVGAMYDGTDDQLPRFLKDGLWENGYTDKYLEAVKSIQVGDRIAIKSSYTRKKNLPFDTHGHVVSVMAIKATGIVTDNVGDGRILGVDWTPPTPPREWYFYTNRSAVWRVLPGDWMTDALIGFAFDDKPQDIKRFCNYPYWRERFGEKPESDQRFIWTKFYEAVADNLLRFKDDRTGLVAGIHAMATRVDCMSILQDQYKDGSSGPLRDICPFTAMSIFNRGITELNRKVIAGEFAQLLGVKEPVPKSFEGIPIVNNQRTWFFGYDKTRQPDDIDKLWEIFAEAIRFADAGDFENHSAFMAAYDSAANCYGVGWNLTMGLYWLRPWCFATLEAQSQRYITKKLNIQIGMNGPKGRCNARDYLAVVETLETRFKEDAYPVHSFPELSLAAWTSPVEEKDEQKHWRKSIRAKIDLLCQEKNSAEFTRQEFLDKFLPVLQDEYPGNNTIESTISYQLQRLRDDGLLDFLSRGNYKWLGFEGDASDEEIIPPKPPIIPYSIDNIVADGCFISQSRLEQILERLRTKKNLILQGPPGTGKTWLAKRLAFALMGQRNENKLRAVQFHPNLSYEDFIRGWRPAGDGKLTLVDGPFLEMIKAAVKESAIRHVVVIEEINRGNPAQIFGEMLTLLEADKRTPNEALELCYRREDDERVFIPDNLYVIGTMNIADRSLALVDLALRRRFAFIDLEPMLNSTWHDWVCAQFAIDPGILIEIEKRITLLNSNISADTSLGAQYRVGHSYVTPPSGATIDDAREWFRQIVDTEIGPLLDEYWFDALGKAQKAREQLLEGF
jgi:5-methylcytosine-specific restriction protein B